MTESSYTSNRITEIRDEIHKQTRLLQQLVDMQERSSPTAAEELTDKEAHDIGWTYELHVPEEPPVRTVAVDKNGLMWQRRAGGWNAGGIFHYTWVNLLSTHGPLRVIDRARPAPIDEEPSAAAP